jgi:hypothetical protein
MTTRPDVGGATGEHVERRDEADSAVQPFVVVVLDEAPDNSSSLVEFASCEFHGLEPWRYLCDLLYLLPDWPKSRVLELAPAYFEQTLQQEEAKRRLAENPLRRALLAFAR